MSDGVCPATKIILPPRAVITRVKAGCLYMPGGFIRSISAANTSALLHQRLQRRFVSRPVLLLLRREPQTLLERGQARDEPRIDRPSAILLRETRPLPALTLRIPLLSINNR